MSFHVVAKLIFLYTEMFQLLGDFVPQAYWSSASGPRWGTSVLQTRCRLQPCISFMEPLDTPIYYSRIFNPKAFTVPRLVTPDKLG